MPRVLTTNALILCPHGGKGTTHPLVDKWRVNNGTVAAEGDFGDILCPQLLMPCLKYTLKSMGLNATTIDGRRAILETDFNQTDTGLPLTIKDFHQTYDDTLPAPVPADGSDPVIPAPLLNEAPPVATPVPQVYPVKVPPPTPLPVKHKFSIAAPFPLRWILTQVSEKPGVSIDLTSGAPGVNLTPTGGHWTAPSMDIDVELTPPFLSALLPADHHFYLTAITQRGVNSSTHFTVKVSP